MISAVPLVSLADTFNLNRPDINFPVLGNRWLIGLLFLTHIIFGSFSMGAVLLAPALEWLGVRRSDPRFERLAHGIAATNLKVFSLGATLGAFAVIALTGLYPRLFTSLITVFFWPMLIAFSSWFVTIPLLLLYVFRWDRMALRKGRHITLGALGGLSEQLFLFLIVGLDSFMLTPSRGLGLDTFFNASYWPELLHRFVGNISWAALFVAGVMAVYAGVSRAEERLYYHWAARTSLVIGFLSLIVQVALGFLFVESIKNGSPGAFRYSLEGAFAWLWILQALLLGILLVGSNLYFLQSRPGRGPVPSVLTGAVAVLALLTMAPAALYGRPLYWLRYIALGLALLFSLAHFLLWRRRAGEMFDRLRRGGQMALTVTGTTALLLFLLMGIIRATARIDYTVYGQLRESDSHGVFQAPSKGFYP